MTRPLARALGFGLAFVVVTAWGLGPAQAETLVGSNVDSRVTLAFKVPDAAAQAWLPEGWTLKPVAAEGPLAGSNLLVLFIDRHLNLDPEGKPAAQSTFRAFALVSPGGRGEETRLFVTRVFITDVAVNPYKNSIQAAITRRAALESRGNDAAQGREEWLVDDGAGGTIAFRMSYHGAAPGWSEREAMPYSNVEPDFHRIYRYQQVAALVRSVPAGVDRLDDYAFTTSVEELAAMFDGSEELVAIINIPWYSRRTFLP